MRSNNEQLRSTEKVLIEGEDEDGVAEHQKQAYQDKLEEALMKLTLDEGVHLCDYEEEGNEAGDTEEDPAHPGNGNHSESHSHNVDSKGVAIDSEHPEVLDTRNPEDVADE